MILTNHLGYDSKDFKRAVYQGKQSDTAGKFFINDINGKVVYEGNAKPVGETENWNMGYCWDIDFSDLDVPGEYIILLETLNGIQKSFPFEIEDFLITMRMINAAGYYFKTQRCTGEWNEEDKHVKFVGNREGVFDIHGGWYDATGDVGIHMSHLSHGHVYNPQQVSLAGYAFFKASEWLGESENIQYTLIRRRMLDEGSYGADYIMNMRAPSGTFFRSVCRTNSFEHVRKTRGINLEYRGTSDQFEINDAAKKEIITDENYEVCLRSGGGLCIATLAAASRHYYPGTEHSREEYLQAAQDAWHYLEKNNERYTCDGNWNLLDEYCALIALVELRLATEEYEYLYKAQEMAERIMSRMIDKGENMAMLMASPLKPFHHASDEGMPVIALLEYANIERNPDLKKKALYAAEKLMRYTLHLMSETSNPFRYPRFMYSEPDGTVTPRFFFPHDTKVAPWWQGENARLSSLSTAARLLSQATLDENLKVMLNKFASDQLNWIMGLNPFNSCMVEGYGRNNIQYFFEGRYDFINCPGGICNGITSDIEDKGGIAFYRSPCEDVKDNWRWAEQWLPHVSWFILAHSSKKI